ncbi:unnamed protein product [Urochloa humidicola]
MSLSPIKSMAKALLEQPRIQPVPEDHEGEAEAWPSPLTIIGFAFLTFNSGMAVSLYSRDFGAVSYLVSAYMDLVMIFYCRHLYERTPPGLPRRELLKIVMWLLATMHIIALFKLLEFWFLADSSTADFLNDTACPHQHPLFAPMAP